MIRKVTKYEASDGTLLPSKDEAEAYENMLDLHEYIDAHPIFTDEFGTCNGKQFRLWLRKHPRIFVKLLPDEVKLNAEQTPSSQDED